MALIKKTRVTYVPGTPGTPGSPGSAPTPGYYETITTPGTKAWYQETYRNVRQADGTFKDVVIWSERTTPGTSRSVYHPPTAGTPAIPGTPGIAATTARDLNLGWNSGAVSVEVKPANFTLTLEVVPNVVGVVAGVNYSNTGTGYSEIDYGFYFNQGKALVYENGVQKSFAFTSVSGDEFSISRTGQRVTYHKNGTEVYVSTVPSIGAMFADASLYSGGDEITAASFTSTGATEHGESYGTLKALGGQSSNYNYASSRASLQALDGLSSALPHAESYGQFLPVRGLASSYNYSSSFGGLHPIESEASVGALVPTYALASGILQPLLGSARMLTGEMATGSASFKPLVGLSANRPYGASRGVFAPLEGFSIEIPPINGYAYLTATPCTLEATGHDSTGENSFIYTANAPTLLAFGGGKAALTGPKATLAATGTASNYGNAALTAPACTLSATGQVAYAGGGDLTAPRPTLIGFGGGVMSVTIGKATLVATGVVGTSGQGAVTLPLCTLVATGTVNRLSSANLIGPAFMAVPGGVAYLMPPGCTLVAIGSATITASYEAYAVNLNHKGENPVDEVTRYTNFPFTQVVRYQNSYFGLGADGNLYLLEGTTDNGTAIPWAFKTAITDFGTPLKKTISSAYFGGRFGPASAVALYPGEDGVTTYSYSTPRDALAQNHRQKFGKGLKERYYALGASGTGTLELDSIELDVHNMTRRI